MLALRTCCTSKFVRDTTHRDNPGRCSLAKHYQSNSGRDHGPRHGLPGPSQLPPMLYRPRQHRRRWAARCTALAIGRSAQSVIEQPRRGRCGRRLETSTPAFATLLCGHRSTQATESNTESQPQATDWLAPRHYAAMTTVETRETQYRNGAARADWPTLCLRNNCGAPSSVRAICVLRFSCETSASSSVAYPQRRRIASRWTRCRRRQGLVCVC